jgi:dienelactone hydrolase
MKSEIITYAMGTLTAEGALVYDEKVSGKRPAVLMAPNWLGLTDKAIERAKLVAGDRYVVFVADMYGQGKRPADFGEAAALANPLRENAAEQRRRIRAAYMTMIDKAGTLDLIDGADIAAAVSIHGDLKTQAAAKPGAIKAALLVTHGAPDPVVPKADRDAFEQEMEAAGAKWQMLVFSGVLHAYTDEGTDIPGIAAWNEPATQRTYALTQRFIADAFAGKL